MERDEIKSRIHQLKIALLFEQCNKESLRAAILRQEIHHLASQVWWPLCVCRRCKGDGATEEGQVRGFLDGCHVCDQCIREEIEYADEYFGSEWEPMEEQ